MNRAAEVATGVLRQIQLNFHLRDRHIFMKLYKQYVRPNVEFSIPAWSPWLRGDIETIERVQEKAVEMVTELKARL